MSPPPQTPLPETPSAPKGRRWLGMGILKWVGIAIAILAVVIVVGLWLVVRPGPVHRYVLAKARAAASQALGSSVEMREFQLHLSGLSPSVDVYGVVVPGAPPYQSPPLARIPHIRVDVQITSLLRRTWQVNNITVDRPSVYIFADAAGHTNLPSLGGSSGGSGTNVFTLGIRHLAIHQGEVQVNDRASDLEADLRQVHLETRYVVLRHAYEGSFGYQSGRLRMGGYQPIPNGLAVRFDATAAGAELNPITITAAGSTLRARATITDYAQPAIAATYRLDLDGTRARALLAMPELPEGTIHVTGTLDYRTPAGPDQPSGLEALSAKGSFSSPELLEVLSGSRRPGAKGKSGSSLPAVVPVRDLTGAYVLSHGNASVRRVRAQLMGGELQADVQVRNLAGTSSGEARLHLAGAELGTLGQVVLSKPQSRTLREAGITGVVGTDATARWEGGFNHLQAQATATLRAQVAPQSAAPHIAAAKAAGGTEVVAAPPGAGASPIPVNGLVAVGYAGNRLTVTQSRILTPESSLSMNGTIALRGRKRARLAIRADSRNLAELETLVDGVANGLGASPVPPQGLSGTASVAGQVSGSLEAPEFAGTIQAANLHVHQTAWKSLDLYLGASPNRVQVAHATLVPASGGRIQLNGSAGLSDWSFSKTSPLQIELKLQRFSLAQVEPLTRKLPVAGILNADLAIHGSAESPIGEGNLRLAPGEINLGGMHQPIRSITAALSGNGNAVQGKIQLVMAAGKVDVNGTYFPQQQRYAAQLRSSGIQLDKLQRVEQAKLGLTGVLSITGQGKGTIDNPEFAVAMAVPTLTVANQAVTDLRLQANVANHVAHGVLASNAVATTVHGEATVQLNGGYETTASLDTGTIPLTPLLAAYAPGVAGSVAGSTQVHATLKGPLEHIDQVQAEVEIPRLELHYEDVVHVAETQPIHLELSGGVLTLHPATLAGEDTRVVLAGEVPLVHGAAMKVSANGDVNLRLVQAFVPDMSTRGALKLNVQATGTLQDPNAQGEITISNFSLTDPDLPVGLSRTNGTLRLSGHRITVASLTGSVGGGTLAASGGVTLGSGMRFDLGLKIEQARLLYPPTLRETLGGTITLAGTTDSALLNGRIQVEDVSVTPQFDFTQFLGNFGGTTGVAAAPGSFTQNCRLNVNITTPNEIHIVSRDFSLQAGANVTLRGTLAQPVILGRVNLNEGDLIFRGNRYVIGGGTLDFVNPNETRPMVNVTADTTIQQYDLHLRFTGPADNLRTAYTSDPALPPADIINLLAFGETTEASAANPSPGNLGAETLLASAVTGQITDRVQRIAGISQLSVDPVLGGNQQNAGARITIQQRVTGNLFVTISTDVTSTQRNVIEVQYKLSPRVSVSGVRKQNGGFGINTRFKRSW